MPLKKKMSGGNCPSGFICFDNTTILMLIIIILIIIIAFLYYRHPYNQPVEKPKENSLKYEEPTTYVLPSEKIYVVDESPSLFDYRYWYPSSYWYPSRYGSNYYDNRTTHYHNDDKPKHKPEKHKPEKPKPEQPRPRPEQPRPRPEQPRPRPEQPRPEQQISTTGLALSEPVIPVKNEIPLQLPNRNEPVVMNKNPEPVVMDKAPPVINEVK